MRKKTKILTALAVVILGLVIWLNYIHLSESFGAGPPYYGRTTNMDKWTNPIPLLIMVDAIAVVVAILVLRIGLRKKGSR